LFRSMCGMTWNARQLGQSRDLWLRHKIVILEVNIRDTKAQFTVILTSYRYIISQKVQTKEANGQEILAICVIPLSEA
jgi:hypothetical protein